ncbi:UNVERIFIED_CONTAM: hypothetical protein FKN15_037519 [Acipenser sinensis]
MEMRWLHGIDKQNEKQLDAVCSVERHTEHKPIAKAKPISRGIEKLHLDVIYDGSWLLDIHIDQAQYLLSQE